MRTENLLFIYEYNYMYSNKNVFRRSQVNPRSSVRIEVAVNDWEFVILDGSFSKKEMTFAWDSDSVEKVSADRLQNKKIKLNVFHSNATWKRKIQK